MAGILKTQRQRVSVDHAIKQCDKFSGHDTATQEFVYFPAQRAGSANAGGECPHHRLEVRHEQRRGDPLAGNIRQANRDLSRRQRQNVEIIAANGMRRLPRTRHLEPLYPRNLARQQMRLDFVGSADVRFLSLELHPPHRDLGLEFPIALLQTPAGLLGLKDRRPYDQRKEYAEPDRFPFEPK